jgi:hypothetical protein
MIFCAIPITEKWPFFAYDDRKEAVLVLDGYNISFIFLLEKLSCISDKNKLFFLGKYFVYASPIVFVPDLLMMLIGWSAQRSNHFTLSSFCKVQ